MTEWEKWPSNLPLEEQVSRLVDVLLVYYKSTIRSGGAIEEAARILWEWAIPEPALNDGEDRG